MRNRILLIARAASPMAVDAAMIAVGLEAAGFKLGTQQVAAECAYLAEKDLLCLREDRVSVGRTLYAITAEGREHLERNGFLC